MRPAPEVVLGHRYELTERIAGGGMGEVWRARDQVLGREVAVKILRKEYADDPTFLERFRAEARHAANLSHPGVAAVYDFGEGRADGENPYLVMEHVPGEPLSALIGREGRLDPRQTMDIVGQTAMGLQAAHDAGVIHRDVKPGNILVTPQGEVKITDFGIARATNSVPLTQTGAIMGTAYYISPEQASGGSVTPASDLYSLGIVAYECLSGRRPFAGDTPVSVALAQVRDEPPALPDDVPAPVRALVMRLLAKDPADRPASAGALGREALALAPTLADASPPPPVDPTRMMPVLADADIDSGVTAGSGATTTVAAVPHPEGPRTDPGFRLPSVTRTPTWLPYAIALAGGLLLILLLARACGGEGQTVGTTEESSGASAPATVEVVADDYLGRPVDQVRQELVDLGLRVDAVRSPGGGTVGTVKDVSPTGALAAGSTVTIGVVTAPPEEQSRTEHGSGRGKGKGNGKGKDD